jgi:hypothetical protein
VAAGAYQEQGSQQKAVVLLNVACHPDTAAHHYSLTIN